MDEVYSAPNDISIKPQPAKSPKLLDRLRHVLRATTASFLAKTRHRCEAVNGSVRFGGIGLSRRINGQ